jgi:hypothetical protein
MAFLFKSSDKSRSRRYGSKENFGVGIVFKSGPDEALFVKSISEGGPASLSNPPIRVNDCLLKVDGDDVYRMPISKVVDYILGDENSSIELTFQRFAGNRLENFTVKLRRGRAATIRANVDNIRTSEDENIDQPFNETNEITPNADQLELPSQSMPRNQLTHQERAAIDQTRLSERLEKMKDLKSITALAFTGKSSKIDLTGSYEGDIKVHKTILFKNFYFV